MKILILNGWAGNHAIWEPLLKRLSVNDVLIPNLDTQLNPLKLQAIYEEYNPDMIICWSMGFLTLKDLYINNISMPVIIINGVSSFTKQVPELIVRRMQKKLRKNKVQVLSDFWQNQFEPVKMDCEFLIKEEEHSPIDTDILIKGLDQLVNEVHLVEDFYQRHKNFVCLHASQDKIYRSEVSSSLPKDHFIEVGKCHASQWTDSQQLAYIIEDYF